MWQCSGQGQGPFGENKGRLIPVLSGVSGCLTVSILFSQLAELEVDMLPAVMHVYGGDMDMSPESMCEPIDDNGKGRFKQKKHVR